MDFEPFLFAGSDTDVDSTIGVSDSADVELFGIPKLPKLGTWSFGASLPSSSVFSEMLINSTRPSSPSTVNDIDDVNFRLDFSGPLEDDAAAFGSVPGLDDPTCTTGQRRKERSPNLLPYEFGDMEKSNWYTRFLAPEVRETTHLLCRERPKCEFLTHFRRPLSKVEELVDLFISNGWVRKTKHCQTDEKLRIKNELLILGCLNMLSLGQPLRALKTNTNISTTEHWAGRL